MFFPNIKKNTYQITSPITYDTAVKIFGNNIKEMSKITGIKPLKLFQYLLGIDINNIEFPLLVNIRNNAKGTTKDYNELRKKRIEKFNNLFVQSLELMFCRIFLLSALDSEKRILINKLDKKYQLHSISGNVAYPALFNCWIECWTHSYPPTYPYSYRVRFIGLREETESDLTLLANTLGIEL